MNLIRPIVLALLCASSVLGWGQSAHRAIATLAYSKLDPGARSRVDFLMQQSPNFRSIEDAAVWPDTIRFQSRATARWHFVRYKDPDPVKQECVPPLSKLPPSCSSSTLCAVSVVAVFAHALRTQCCSHSWTDAAHQLAFVVHLMGDLFQPLHASAYLNGGNGVPVVFRHRHTNLHAVENHSSYCCAIVAMLHGINHFKATPFMYKVWDHFIPEWTIQLKYNRSYDSWVHDLQTLAATNEPAACLATVNPLSLANTTVCLATLARATNQLVCKVVYPPGFQVNQQTSTDYYESVSDVVDMQIARSGLSLASLLNTIFSHPPLRFTYFMHAS